MLRASIKWIMLVSGALTCTMVYAAIAPRAMLQSTFGESVDGPLAELVVRNWGALIFLVGAMLIYGAFYEAVRPLVLVVAAASKIVFIVLVLSNGSRYLQTQAGISIAVDSVMVLVFLAYVVARRPATS
jgi:predicted permease